MGLQLQKKKINEFITFTLISRHLNLAIAISVERLQIHILIDNTIYLTLHVCNGIRVLLRNTLPTNYNNCTCTVYYIIDVEYNHTYFHPYMLVMTAYLSQ